MKIIANLFAVLKHIDSRLRQCCMMDRNDTEAVKVRNVIVAELLDVLEAFELEKIPEAAAIHGQQLRRIRDYDEFKFDSTIREKAGRLHARCKGVG